MKTLYLIGGTMGVGKTTVSQQLKKELTNSVFLDGDWCWDADPFQVTDETKEMVMDNICYLLNNFLHCSAYENVIFCWVMHEQSIVDEIVSKLDTEECRVIKISLIVDEANLRKRLLSDIANKIRTEEIMDKSIARIQMYQVLDTVKIDTSNKSVCEIAIVVCKEYQNRHIGRRCVLEMLKLAKEKGMGQVTANIYSFNRQSQRMFQSVGFEKTTDEWYAYKL